MRLWLQEVQGRARATLQGKAKEKEYNANPHRKARQKEYQRNYRAANRDNLK